MKRILTLILILFSVSVYCQSRWTTITFDEFKELTTKIGEIYQTDIYTVNMRYSSYKGKNYSTPFETSLGFVQKSKNRNYSYLMGITTISDAEITLTIDSTNSMVAINKGNKNIEASNIIDQYEQVKANIDKMSLMEFQGEKTIKIEYKTNSPISKVELKLKRNSELKEVMIFYAQAKEYETEEGETKSDYVSLKIEYLDFQKKLLHKELKANDIIENSKGQYQLTSKFSEFELIDLRYNN